MNIKKIFENNRVFFEIFLLIFLTIIISILFSFRTDNLTWDSSIYVNNAVFFSGTEYLYDEIRPPIYPMVLSLPVKLFGISIIPLFIFDLIVRGLCVAGFYLLIKRFSKNKLLPFFSVFGFVLNPIMKDIPPFMTEYLSLLFIFLGVYFILKYYERGKDKRESFLYLSFLSMSLSFLTRYTSLFLILVIGIFILIKEKKDIFSWENVKRFSIASGIFILPVALWGIWNKIYFGEFFFSIYRAYHHIQYDAVLTSRSLILWGSPAAVLFTINILLIPLVAYVISFIRKRRKEDIEWIFLLWLFIYLISIIQSNHQTVRYLFFFMPPIYFFIFSAKKKKYLLIFAAIVIASFFISFPKEDVGFYYNSSIEFNSPGPVVGSLSPQMALMLKTRTYSFTEFSCEYLSCPLYPWSFYEKYGCENITHVVSHTEMDLPCVELLEKKGRLYFYNYKG